MIPSPDQPAAPDRQAWPPVAHSGALTTRRCLCGRSIFFPNTVCLGCRSPLGYEPTRGELRALRPAAEDGYWHLAMPGDETPDPTRWRRCANLKTAADCNWLIPEEDGHQLCTACRLNRTIPDLGDKSSRRWWYSIERAKRRLVAQLIDLGLPVRSKLDEDPDNGLMFDLLRPLDDGRRVLTGHDNGLVTLNVEEADDAIREKTRQEMGEPYRTLLGHCRHEVGHYYWDRLIAGTDWLAPFRALFGDERENYAAALERHYQNGPRSDWSESYISSYASVHPWEDWAETWAHYLHLEDTLETARSLQLPITEWGENPLGFTREDLHDPDDRGADEFLHLVNSWVHLTTVLNELARSMGQHDLYPFVLNRPVVAKLHFIDQVVSRRSSA